MKISIIIPTLNEAKTLPETLANPEFHGPEVEVIVSDGGSTDGTDAIAKAGSTRVVTGPAGRGAQSRRGAHHATGDVLLFLHADTRLARGSLAAIRSALAESDVIGGNFRLVFNGDDAFSTWLTGFYARIRARGLYYGDSAIFLRRGTYEALGGIRPIALMEDYDLSRRLEREGPTICIHDAPAVTSSRRFQDRRPWKIVTQWLFLHALFALRVSPDRLAMLYRSKDHMPGRRFDPKESQAGVRSSASSFQR